MPSLVKIFDWNLIRRIRVIQKTVSELFRIIPKQSENRFVSHLKKNGQKSIWHNPIHSASIRARMYLNRFSIRMNPRSELDWESCLKQSEHRLMPWIEAEWIRSSRINFWSIFILRDTKRFPNWFVNMYLQFWTFIERWKKNFLK